MAVTVHPTLDLMAEIYTLSRDGGADSVRFRRYVDLAGSGHPVHAYNPMTANPETLATVEALREIDAETLVLDTLKAFPGLADLDTAVVVLTPGFWTDHLFNEVRQRRDGLDAVWFWAGETVDEKAVRVTATAKAIRTIWWRAHGPAKNLRQFAGQEATVANAVGFEPAHADAATSDVLDIVGGENDDHTLIAYLFGDERAEDGGWRGLGLSGDEGPRTVARWLDERTDWDNALETGWTPSRLRP